MINVVCLKWGKKYSSEFPNRLYTMLKKTSSQQFTLYCCTEDAEGLHPDIVVIPLPEELKLETFWWKLWITSNRFPVKGKIVYLDLDSVIQNDLKPIFEYDSKDKLGVLFAQWRYIKVIRQRVDMTAYNSSVMVWDNTIYEDRMFEYFMSNPEYYMMKYHGNDDFMEREFPEIIQSLPIDWVYCRVWGYDDTVPDRQKRAPDRYIDLWNIRLQLYRMPERLICMFNGIKPEEGIDDRIWQGFEHYWSD